MGRRQARSLDVARLAGVSRTTVSFVLNNVPGVKITEETRQRVLEAARELNYYPTAAARSLASGKTQRIGLILGEGQKRLSADAFLPTFLQGVTASVHRRGYLLMLQLAEDVPSHEAYARLIREQQVDGLIISGPRVDDPLLPELAEDQFPLILHGRLDVCSLPWVDVDNKAGAYQAVTHLIGLGTGRSALSRTRRLPTPGRRTASPATGRRSPSTAFPWTTGWFAPLPSCPQRARRQWRSCWPFPNGRRRCLPLATWSP